jgi:hypothetical protein
VSVTRAARAWPVAGELMLLGRVWCGVALVRLLKYVVPLRTLVTLARAGVHVRPSAARTAQLKKAAAGVHLGHWRVPGNCLERSLVLYRLFLESGANPHLVIGLTPAQAAARSGAGASTAPGHVWITLANERLGAPGDDEPKFIPIVAFDASGQRYQPCGNVDVQAC